MLEFIKTMNKKISNKVSILVLFISIFLSVFIVYFFAKNFANENIRNSSYSKWEQTINELIDSGIFTPGW